MLSSSTPATADSLRASMHLRNLTALERLEVAARSLEQCSDLLCNLTPPHLACASIIYDTQAPDHAFHAFLRVIAHFHDRSPSLHTLILRHSFHNKTAMEPPFVISPSTLAPLLACNWLHVLELANAGTFDIDDAFLVKAARAWPALRELRLANPLWFIGHRATLAGIRELVRHCPHLMQLHLPFDGRVLPDGDDGASSTDVNVDIDTDKHVAAQKASLDELDVCNSPINDPHGVADFLSAVAPRLKSLIIKAMDGYTHRKWEEVQHLLGCNGFWRANSVDY